jgi:hypothetical protein
MFPGMKPEVQTGPEASWWKHHAIGLVTLALGVTGFLVVALSQPEFWSQPDWRLSLPFLVVTVATGVVSLARREGARYLPLLGIGLAASAMVLGFVVVFGVVVALTALVIFILSGVM